MNSTGRLKNVYINATVVFGTQIVQIIMSFILRRIFIEKLGLEYMGYSGVFANILQMLNLADLGIGVAISSFLYKPIADKDDKAVSALIYIYKRVYFFIAIFIAAMGIIISFFMHLIISDYSGNVGILRIYFLLHLAGVISSYFFAYKRTLLVAEQKTYILSLIDIVNNLFFTVVQIILLITVPNYTLFLCIAFIQGIVANIIISNICNKHFKCIKESCDQAIVKVYEPQVVEYVKDIFVSRIGAYVYYSTDNVIISIFKNSLLVGYYSNYSTITLQIYNIVAQILGSVQATFGNFVHLNKDKEQQRKMVDVYLFSTFFIGNFCTFCILFMIQPFIELWLGKEFLMERSTVYFMAINLLLMILIQVPSQVFIIYKLFRYDKIVIIISAVLNIIISIALVRKLGVDGVLIGTLVTSLFYLFSRLYIISSKIFEINYLHYICKIFIWFLSSFVMVCIGEYIFEKCQDVSISMFIVRSISVVFFAIFSQILLLGWTPECKYIIKKVFSKRFNNK